MITSEIMIAYAQCKLKAHLLLHSGRNDTRHECISILEEESKKNREKYLARIKVRTSEVKPYSLEEMKKGIPTLVEAKFTFGDLEAYADILTRLEQSSSKKSIVIFLP